VSGRRLCERVGNENEPLLTCFDSVADDSDMKDSPYVAADSKVAPLNKGLYKNTFLCSSPFTFSLSLYELKYFKLHFVAL
jgi:hypothetical protein